MARARALAWAACALAMAAAVAGGPEARKVTYDARGFMFDGRRELIQAGSVHYPRLLPSEWRSTFRGMRQSGLNAVEFVVFWNLHEATPGKLTFEEYRYNITRFLAEAHDEGLYAIVRIGPYICAEWALGGLPWHLRKVEAKTGMAVRTNDTEWERRSGSFVDAVVGFLRRTRLLYDDGGPVVMLQIENEYGNVEAGYGNAGKRYVVDLGRQIDALNARYNLNVPWIMCQQADAPPNAINTVNGFYAGNFEPNRPGVPKVWTEVWSGWFTAWGQARPARPSRDIAYAVAKFVASGGTMYNYYMWAGGTNFGTSSGGPGLASSYDYDAPVDEFGYLRPKGVSLAKMHHALERVAHATLASDRPAPRIVMLRKADQAMNTYEDDGPMHELPITLMLYRAHGGRCTAFLVNDAADNASTAVLSQERWSQILGMSEESRCHAKELFIPPWSVTILEDCELCKAYNTADHVRSNNRVPPGPVTRETRTAAAWTCARERAGVKKEANRKRVFTSKVPLSLLELIDGDPRADYAFYEPVHLSRLIPNMSHSDESAITLNMSGIEDFAHVFANDTLIATSLYPPPSSTNVAETPPRSPVSILSYSRSIVHTSPASASSPYTWGVSEMRVNISSHVRPSLLPYTRISILAGRLGTVNYGAHFFEDAKMGIGGVALGVGGSAPLPVEAWDNQGWAPSPPNSSAYGACDGMPAMKWLRACIAVPTNTTMVGLSLRGMSKGFAMVNGFALGRYYLINAQYAPGQGTCLKVCEGAEECNAHMGQFQPWSCLKGCGSPTQHVYKVPAEVLEESFKESTSCAKGTAEVLLFEELGGDPGSVSLVDASAGFDAAQCSQSPPAGAVSYA